MTELDWLAGRFEENRAHLHAVAYRMLGTAAEAEDAVQEAWLRVSRADADEVENLAGWLTTITARVCLNILQKRRSHPEEPVGAYPPEPVPGQQDSQDPEGQALLAESVGHALLVVLDTLAPAERVAFVLHDMFAVPFEEIAATVGRSPTAARQLASRARRRIQGAPAQPPDRARQRELVAAFLTAAQRGDFAALLELLDPDVILSSDQATVRIGGPGNTRGSAEVAGIFSGRAQAADLALIDGTVGMAWAPHGQPRVIFTFTVTRGKITAISMTADPSRLRELDVAIMDG